MGSAADHVLIVIDDKNGKRMTLRLSPGMSVAIIGLDGTGKSTAVAMLERALGESRLPTSCFHWYSAYQTCVLVPLQIWRNRASKASVQIFDRSIFDNFAVWSQRIGNAAIRGRLLRWAAKAAQLLYPRFDAIIHLTAEPDVIGARRPDMTDRQITLGSEVYGLLGAVLRTDPLDTVSIRRATA